MEFDIAAVRRGLYSAEKSVTSPERISIDLWQRVADDLWGWLVRVN